MHALVFLCVKPSKLFFTYIESIKNEKYDIYVVIDDNTFNPEYNIKSNIKIIQYDNKIPEINGFKNCVLGINRACSRDKALYHFCRKNNIEYKYIWMIEEDVFIPHIDIIFNLDKKYLSEDLLCRSYIIKNKEVPLDWHWDKVKNKIELPWASSMICIIRISQKLLNCVEKYAETKKELFLDEALFTTLSLHNNLKVENPKELINVVYQNDWNIDNIDIKNVFHPVKDIEKQFFLRKKIKTHNFNYFFYWINLERASERRKNLSQMFSERNIKNKRIEALDGTKDNLEEYINNFKQEDIMKYKLEISTTISHLKAIYEFVKSEESCGVICEDDLIFDLEDKWPYTLNSIILDAPKKWEIIQLSITMDNTVHKWDMTKERYQLRKWYWHSALSYLISKEYAVKILKKYNISVSKDFSCNLFGDPKNFQSEPVIIGTGENIYTLYPPAFTYPTNNISFIHPSHIKLHDLSKNEMIKNCYN